MIKTFLIILSALLVQIQLAPALGLKLDLMAMAVIYLGMRYGWKRGLGAGITAGILQDIFSTGIFGITSIGLGICGVLAGYSRQTLLLRYWIVRIILVFLLTLLNLTLYLGISALFYKGTFLSLFSSQWFPICAGNTITAGILFWIIDKYG